MLQTGHVTTKKQTFESLLNEVRLLRSSIIGFLGKDDEGEYSPKFVRDILNRTQDKAEYTFQDADNFLKLLK